MKTCFIILHCSGDWDAYSETPVKVVMTEEQAIAEVEELKKTIPKYSEYRLKVESRFTRVLWKKYDMYTTMGRLDFWEHRNKLSNMLDERYPNTTIHSLEAQADYEYTEVPLEGLE